MLIDFRQLFPRWNIKPTGVLHIGANVGEEAPVYHELGIKKVIWIEGNPELMPALLNNISQYPDQRAYNFLAGEDTKMATLHISNNAGQSSSVLDLGTHKIAHPEVHYIGDVSVQMFRMDERADLFEACDFLNIDAQGFEGHILRGMGETLKQFRWAYLELNRDELYLGCTLIDNIDLYMLSFGFRRVETRWAGNAGWSDGLYVRH
jgi:FkbM family methyltransferase